MNVAVSKTDNDACTHGTHRKGNVATRDKCYKKSNSGMGIGGAGGTGMGGGGWQLSAGEVSLKSTKGSHDGVWGNGLRSREHRTQRLSGGSMPERFWNRKETGVAGQNE